MTSLDDWYFLRFDAETGRISATEAVERAAELAEEIEADVEELKAELEHEEYDHKATAETEGVLSAILHYIVETLGKAEDRDVSADELRQIVRMDILENVACYARGWMALDVEELQRFLDNRKT